METRAVAAVTLVLTVLLLSVSLSSFLYHWMVVNGYNLDMFVRVLLVYTPLGLVFLSNVVYLWNPMFRLMMDLLFLVPYTLAVLVTGPITVFSFPLSKVAGCEKFEEAKNWLRTIVTQGEKREKRSVYAAISIILILYAIVLLQYLFRYTTIPADSLLWISITFVYGILSLVSAISIMERVVRERFHVNGCTA